MRPFFQILMGDQDVTARVGLGNVSLTITDGVGLSSDTIQFVISDENGIIAPPTTGVDIVAIGGYRDGAQRNFGKFTVDDVTLEGWPQQITVNAQSVGAKTSLKAGRSRSYKPPKFKTYGEVLTDIAKRNGLTLAVVPAVASKPLDFEAQAEESDDEFVTRLGARMGFDMTIKDKHLTITKRGKGAAVSGFLLPIIEVVGGRNVVSYSVSRKDKPKYGRVRATWFDREAAETRELDEAAWGEGPDLLLRTPYRSEEEARDAAKAKAENLRRNGGSASFVIVGEPQARAEAFVEASNIRSLVDGRWRATTVSHTFSGGEAYTTSIECELPDGDSNEGDVSG